MRITRAELNHHISRLDECGQASALGPVDQKHGNLGKITLQQRIRIRRRLEDDLHSLVICLVDQLRQTGNLVLQQNDIALSEGFQHLINEFLCNAVVGTAVLQYGILPHDINLNDCMSGFLRNDPNKFGMYAFLLQCIQQHLSVLADHTGLPHLGTCTRQCDRLIQPLAAGDRDRRFCNLCFLCTGKMLYTINMIQIQRSKVKNFHDFPPLIRF